MVDFSWCESFDSIRDMLAEHFSGLYPDITFIPDERLMVGRGESDDKFVVVGDYGSRSNDAYFSMIWSIFHEYRHVEQRKSNFLCCGKYASECRLDDIACQGSRLYYGAGARKEMIGNTEVVKKFLYTRYYRNIREIDAEYHGVMDMYKYLLQNPSWYSGDLNGAFLEHINQNIHNPGKLQEYFLDFHEPIQSMEKLDQKFEMEFVNQVHSRRLGYKPAEDDVSFVGILANSDISGWAGAFSRYENAKDGFSERRILAGIVRAVHPEYTQNLPYGDRKAIGTFRTFHMMHVPEIPGEVLEKFKILPDDERWKYYLESVDRLSQFDVPDGSPGAGPETVSDFSENFP